MHKFAQVHFLFLRHFAKEAVDHQLHDTVDQVQRPGDRTTETCNIVATEWRCVASNNSGWGGMSGANSNE
jgi:hypothetical protein